MIAEVIGVLVGLSVLSFIVRMAAELLAGVAILIIIWIAIRSYF